MKGVVASTASWDTVIKLAGQNGYMEIKEKEVNGAAVTKLYVNKSIFGQGPKGVNEIYQRRLAAANSVREKFKQNFEAQYPDQTGDILRKYSALKYGDGFKGSDVRKMDEAMRKSIQFAEVDEHFTDLDLPAGLLNASKFYYMKDWSKSSAEEPRNLQPEKLKQLSAEKASELRTRSYGRAVALVSGMAMQLKDFSENGFANHDDLKRAMEARGFGGVMAGVSGRAVFLLPQVLNHEELQPFKDIIALSVLSQILDEDGGDPKGDAVRDAHLALKILGRDFNFADATNPGVKQDNSLQERLLRIMDSMLPPVNNRQVGSHRADRPVAEWKINKAMKAVKSVQERLDLPAPDGEKKTKANNLQNPDVKSANIALEGALGIKRRAILDAVKLKVDSELQETGSPGDVIKKLLNDLAGEEGRLAGEKVVAKNAELVAFRETIEKNKHQLTEASKIEAQPIPRGDPLANLLTEGEEPLIKKEDRLSEAPATLNKDLPQE